MIVVGIDPGKKGALAALHKDGKVELTPMPIIAASVKKGKKKGRDEYNLTEIRATFFGWNLGAIGADVERLFVMIEKSQPMPPKMPGGGIANYHRGVARGFEWMLAGMGIPYQLVAPQTWQKAMHAGTPRADTKQRSIIAAQRLFPSVSLKRTQRSRKDDDGMAEALLIAEFGRRTRIA